jgi:hypothetical protein
MYQSETFEFTGSLAYSFINALINKNRRASISHGFANVILNLGISFEWKKPKQLTDTLELIREEHDALIDNIILRVT